MDKMRVVNHLLTLRNLNRLLKNENERLTRENDSLKRKLKKIKDQNSIFTKIKSLFYYLEERIGLI